MNRTIIGRTAATFIMIAMATLAMAQQSPLAVTVPFDFYAGKTLVSAGQYSIKQINTGAYSIRNTATNEALALILTMPVPTQAPLSKAKLMFTQYGNDHFLSQICWPGNSVAEVVKDKHEIQLAKDYRANARIAVTMNRN